MVRPQPSLSEGPAPARTRRAARACRSSGTKPVNRTRSLDAEVGGQPPQLRLPPALAGDDQLRSGSSAAAARRPAAPARPACAARAGRAPAGSGAAVRGAGGADHLRRAVVDDGDPVRVDAQRRRARCGSTRTRSRTGSGGRPATASRDSIHQPIRASTGPKTTGHCSRCTWWTRAITGRRAYSRLRNGRPLHTSTIRSGRPSRRRPAGRSRARRRGRSAPRTGRPCAGRRGDDHVPRAAWSPRPGHVPWAWQNRVAR